MRVVSIIKREKSSVTGTHLTDFVTGREGRFFLESRTISGILKILLIDFPDGPVYVTPQWFLRQPTGYLDGITRNWSSAL